ncbi:MAG: hypothetical protein ACR2IV_22235 [Bryobacteraceae bacterium]
MPRPSFKPTAEQRKLVRSLAAVGLRQEWICEMLRLRSPKTLRKHFRAELWKGQAEATAAVARTAYEMALSGRYPAMLLFWLKCQAPADPLLDTVLEKRARQPPGSGGMVVLGLPIDRGTEDKLDAAA